MEKNTADEMEKRQETEKKEMTPKTPSLCISSRNDKFSENDIALLWTLGVYSIVVIVLLGAVLVYHRKKRNVADETNAENISLDGEI